MLSMWSIGLVVDSAVVLVLDTWFQFEEEIRVAIELAVWNDVRHEDEDSKEHQCLATASFECC